MEYAEDVAIKCPFPVDKIEIADHFLSGLRKGLSTERLPVSFKPNDQRDLPAHARI